MIEKLFSKNEFNEWLKELKKSFEVVRACGPRGSEQLRSC